jgi:peptidoglycan/LPS O-acetylase OafA/YrhL
LFGALTFTANIFLWLQTGYFEQDAAFKSLLHLWSLSIEEQYYLVLPLFLLIAPNRWRMSLIAVALLSSATGHVTAPDQCCRYVRKFLPGRRPHVTQSSAMPEP